ncbi:MAG: cell division protein FtsZ [Synergistaceae bacterium]|nr:cell division protein FtsZ [Synergistaceae bacterium]
MMEDELFQLSNPSVRQNEKIIVFGVGGGGGNALNHIIESNVQGVDFIAANTDSRALEMNKAPNKILLGEKLTRGLGAGADPSVGANAAKENIDKIKELITGADMLFVTAGMGGGTGTGAAPVIAETARDLGVLVVGVVTKPFGFEMARRMRTAEEGIEQLKKKVDALLIVENDKLLQMENGAKMKIVEAYKKVDEVLRQAVQGVTDLITKSGFINLDFADIKAILTGAGTAIMGMGTGEGEDRARKAAQDAIESPLMSLPFTRAKGILLNVTTGAEIALQEMSDAAQIIEATADPDAQVIWGHVIDESLGEKVHVTLIATFPEDEEGRPVNAAAGRTVTGGKPQQPREQNTNPPMDINSLREQRLNNGGIPKPNFRPDNYSYPNNPNARQPQQPQQPQYPKTGGGTLFDIYQAKRNVQQNLEEARLNPPENDEQSFSGLPRRFYDQPAYYRKNNKN